MIMKLNRCNFCLKMKNFYNNIILKNKIKSYGDEATDFHDKEMPRAGSTYTCLAAILILFLKNKKTVISE